LCHNLFVSAPSPITDRDLLTGQLNAETTSLPDTLHSINVTPPCLLIVPGAVASRWRM